MIERIRKLVDDSEALGGFLKKVNDNPMPYLIGGIAVLLIVGITAAANAMPHEVEPDDQAWFERYCTGPDFGPGPGALDPRCAQIWVVLCPPVDFSPTHPACDIVRLDAVCRAVDFSPFPPRCETLYNEPS